MRIVISGLALALAIAAQPVFAGEAGARPGAWLGAWDADPLVLLNLVTLGVLYVTGVRKLWSSSGKGHVVSHWQVAALGAALCLIGFTLLSPLDAISKDLAAAHMVQHMLLTMVAAPLFVLAAPTYVLAWSIPPAWQRWLFCDRRLRRLLWRPDVAWCLYAVVLWGWHHPVMYHAALRDALVHDAQHVSFFLAGVLFWRVPLEPLARRRRLHPLASVGYLFTTSLHATVLGIFMTLSPAAWYSDYAGRTATWGFSLLEDQQFAGLVMWGPSCLVYPAIAAAVFGIWLARMSTATGDVRPSCTRRYLPGAT